MPRSLVSATSTYRDRRAATIENERLRVTVLVEGGHIAEILDKRSGINPLWTPGWASIEPSRFGVTHHGIFSSGSDGKLLAGIMGHNVCLDMFGGPSEQEAAAGLTAHGEAAVAEYDISCGDGTLSMRTRLPLAGLAFQRHVALVDPSGQPNHTPSYIRITEIVENLGAFDRPIAWTQHVTLGPPFLEKGSTEFQSSATRSQVYGQQFGVADDLVAGAAFQWPMAPRAGGGAADLRRFTSADRSSAYTAHLMDTQREHAFFVAFSPRARLAFGYVWRQRDYPWMGIWQENHSRTQSPWNGEALTCGMEFGVSPFPETRRAMIERARLFDTPTYRWIPARRSLTSEYWVVVDECDRVPQMLVAPQQ
ncbi:MAG TPA: hypothetical protein VGF24_12475 [Vicinamibacterales bacterium]